MQGMGALTRVQESRVQTLRAVCNLMAAISCLLHPATAKSSHQLTSMAQVAGRNAVAQRALQAALGGMYCGFHNVHVAQAMTTRGK